MVSRNEPDESHICSLHAKPCETPEVWLEHLFKRYHKAVFRTVYAAANAVLDSGEPSWRTSTRSACSIT